MNEPEEIKRFNRQLDELLNGSFHPNSRHSSDEYRQLLETASRLSEADFSAGSQQRYKLEEHLRQLAEERLPRQDRRRTIRAGLAKATHALAWTGAGVLLVALISWGYLRLLPGQSLILATQLAYATQAPVATQGEMTPTRLQTVEPELSGLHPTVDSPPVETPLAQVYVPEEKLLTYRDDQLGYAFDYPASWSLQAEDGLLVKVQPPLNEAAQPDVLIPGETEVEIVPSLELEGNTLEDILAQVREENQVLWEKSWQLAGQTPAVRLLAEDDEGQWAGLLTVIHGRGLRLTGRGDMSRFDAIAASLRPIAQVNLQPSATLGEAKIKPLTANSSFSEVHDRMESSWQQWKTLWVDALITTTQGDQTRVEREQVWIQQPGSGLWLSGPAGGKPGKVRIKANGQTVQINLETRNRKELGNTRLVPSLLSKMLLPSWPLALQDGTYQVSGEETIAGRPAIVVQYTNVEGQKADRLWVDAETGVILRWVNVAVSSGSNGVQTSQEIQITSVVYNADFPQELFNLKSPALRNFVAGPGLLSSGQEGSKSK